MPIASVAAAAAALGLSCLASGCRGRTFEVDLRNASDQPLAVQLERNSGGKRQRNIRAELAPGDSFIHRFHTQNRRTSAAALVSAQASPDDRGVFTVPIEANRPVVYDLLVRDGAVLPVPRAD